ncbi:MAG: hypothetical protein IKK95_07125 [Lachnospiraceae bacterium]|nr:hypothetical protein [Lachnospiraceae bacterium]
MKLFKNKEDSLQFWLSLFLLSGSVAGTLFCNQMSEEMKQELVLLGQHSVSEGMLDELDHWELLLQIAPGRVWGLVLLMLVSTTPMAEWCMRFVAGYMGFSNAVIICALTMASGIRGLLQYMILLFPQCICYISVGYLLFWWMPAKAKRFTLISILALIAMVCTGALLECLVNPQLMRWF